MLLTAGDVLSMTSGNPTMRSGHGDYPNALSFASDRRHPTGRSAPLQDDLPDTLWIPPGFVPGGHARRVATRRGDGAVRWHGGDPAVDQPDIHLERLDDTGMAAVTSRSGRPITEDHPDIVHTHTPVPSSLSMRPKNISGGLYAGPWATFTTARSSSGTYRFRVAANTTPAAWIPGRGLAWCPTKRSHRASRWSWQRYPRARR